MDNIKDETISELREKDREHDSRLDSLTAQNQTQDFKLKSQIAKDKEHDFRLDSLVCKNDVQDDELHRQAVKDAEHDMRIDSMEKRIDLLEKQIHNMMKLQVENAMDDYVLESGSKRYRVSNAVRFMTIFSFGGIVVFILLLIVFLLSV